MKKLIVLFVLLGLAGFPLMASDVTISGETTWGFISDFNGDFADSYGKLELDIAAAVDDYNTVEIEIDAEDGFDGALDVAYWKIVSDWGGRFGLTDMGAGIESSAGYFWSGNQEYACISGYENENVAAHGTDVDGGLRLDVAIMDMVNLYVSNGFDPTVYEWLVGAWTEIDPVSVDVYFQQNGHPDGSGVIGLDGAFAMDVADISIGAAACFVYNLDDTALDGDVYGLGAALTVGYAGMVDFSASLNGNDLDIMDGVGLTLGVDPVDFAGLDVGIFLDLLEGAPETLNAVDLSGYLKCGASTTTIGYLVTQDTVPVADKVALMAPTTVAKGGLYMKFDIDY